MSLIRIGSNFLIVSYLSIIYFSGMPDTNTLNYRLKKVTNEIAYCLGIWPSWSMFAPNPIKFDSKTFTVLTFRDGSRIEEDVEPKLTGFFSEFRRARWMKYAQDNLRNPLQKNLLKPLVLHLEWKYRQTNPNLVKIELVRKWDEIHPFSDVGLYPLRSTPRYRQQETLYQSFKGL